MVITKHLKKEVKIHARIALRVRVHLRLFGGARQTANIGSNHAPSFFHGRLRPRPRRHCRWGFVELDFLAHQDVKLVALVESQRGIGYPWQHRKEDTDRNRSRESIT